ncbi:NlpC/P60 family protein [Deinococcus yavapaiensis KR-236]|uniref:NlpC/P60 family protein n=1 Tax=Deinococcus yavapaiensis KR-236 TaxID=694435 RepID=A0A318SLE8_9DEIO|nr:NlpC/P60 family protein [Deinococcus yavapaiensis KR-236]
MSLLAEANGNEQVTQALLGEPLHVLEDAGHGWVRVRTTHDDYEGFARWNDLGEQGGETTLVTTLRGHLYAAPRVSAPILDVVSYGSRLSKLGGEPIVERGRSWWRVAYRGGEAYVGEGVFEQSVAVSGDLGFARRFLDVPYEWGGRSAWGLDCSGLTQLVFGLGNLPRDASQQEDFVPKVSEPRAGDLAFFAGHVGIMLSDRDMLHANATHMRVTIETFGEGEHGTRLAQSVRAFGRWDGRAYREAK